MSAADWPFLEAMPSERAALQRQFVDDDPFLGSLGVRFDEARADVARLTLAFRDGLAQPTGILHGGLHGILIDTAIAQALLTTIRPGFSVVTVRLDTNYFAPVRAGVVAVEAAVVRKGKRIAHGEAAVTDEQGGVVARGWGVFAVVGAPLPA
jgi:uncharacterized protein (TIGR00369 family)